MMEVALVVVALVAAALSLFSGFGLGTLLLPFFAFFYEPHIAVAATAVVHLLNNLLKVALIGKHVSRSVLLRFVVPAIPFAFAGAWLLERLAHAKPLATYGIGDRTVSITPLGLVVGGLVAIFAALELVRWKEQVRLSPRWLPVGGMLSGFFGGLTGHQGALRSVFLLRMGLDKIAFVATAAWAAAMVDVTRLLVYGRGDPGAWLSEAGGAGVRPLLLAMGAAFVGTVVGARLVKKMTLRSLQRIIGWALLAAGLGMASGITLR